MRTKDKTHNEMYLRELESAEGYEKGSDVDLENVEHAQIAHGKYSAALRWAELLNDPEKIDPIKEKLRQLDKVISKGIKNDP